MCMLILSMTVEGSVSSGVGDVVEVGEEVVAGGVHGDRESGRPKKRWMRLRTVITYSRSHLFYEMLNKIP